MQSSAWAQRHTRPAAFLPSARRAALAARRSSGSRKASGCGASGAAPSPRSAALVGCTDITRMGSTSASSPTRNLVSPSSAWNASLPPGGPSPAGPYAPSSLPCRSGVRPAPHGAARASEGGRCRRSANSATAPEIAKRDGPESPCQARVRPSAGGCGSSSKQQAAAAAAGAACTAARAHCCGRSGRRTCVQTTVSVMEPSLKRRSSERSPQKSRNAFPLHTPRPAASAPPPMLPSGRGRGRRGGFARGGAGRDPYAAASSAGGPLSTLRQAFSGRTCSPTSTSRCPSGQPPARRAPSAAAAALPAPRDAPPPLPPVLTGHASSLLPY
jgi:hypothetical protein